MIFGSKRVDVPMLARRYCAWVESPQSLMKYQVEATD